MDFDLANLRAAKTSDEFVHVLDGACATALTADFWSITLPSELATSAARSPSMFAYFASLCLLDARVLFSNQRVSDLLAPGGQGIGILGSGASSYITGIVLQVMGGETTGG